MMLDDHLYSVNTRRSCRPVLRCTDHGRCIGSLEGARPAVAGRAAGALALVQRLRGAARPVPRVGPGRRRARGPDHRGAGRLHRRHPRRRAHQPAGHPARPRAHDVGSAGGRGRERGAGALGRAPHPRARPALSHRRLPGRHLPARDEDRRHLVPRGPRARDRAAGRRAHGGLGRAAPHPRPHRSALAPHPARRLAGGRARRPHGHARHRGAVSLSAGPLRPAHGHRGAARARPPAGLLRLLRSHVGALRDVGVAGGVPGREPRGPRRRQLRGAQCQRGHLRLRGAGRRARRLGGGRARRPLGPHHAHHGRHGALRPVRRPHRARPSAARRC